jgi:hypothetical protein
MKQDNKFTPSREEYESSLKSIHDKFSRVMDELDSASQYQNGVTQYAVNGKQFMPVGASVKVIPAGWYKFTFNGRTYVPEIQDVRNDELVKLPMPEYDAVLNDVDKFRGSEQDYRKYKFPYKRGILLFGRPGTGKSGLIRLLGDDLIKRENGVLFNLQSPDDIYAFESIFSLFREIEPNRPCYCVIEDVDNFVRYGGGVTAKLLNVLDGNMAYDNILFIATTNYPEALIESIANRPSRFDRRYEISTPSPEARKVYIQSKFKDMSVDEVDKIVSMTDNFTIDMLKEVVVSYKVLRYSLEESVKTVSGLFKFGTKLGDSVILDSTREFIDNELKR